MWLLETLVAVYIEQPDLDAFGLPVVGGPQAQEVHRFLIHMPSEPALPHRRGAKKEAHRFGGRWSRWEAGGRRRLQGSAGRSA